MACENADLVYQRNLVPLDRALIGECSRAHPRLSPTIKDTSSTGTPAAVAAAVAETAAVAVVAAVADVSPAAAGIAGRDSPKEVATAPPAAIPTR